MLPKFHISFFSKTYLRSNVDPKLLYLFDFKDSGEAFAAMRQIKQAKIIVIEGSGHKCVCNNSTRESENLKYLFCKNDILNLIWD